MSYVTFETALRLKEVRFPQPKPAPGQFWYDGNEDLYVIQQDQGSDGVCGAFMDMDDTFVEPQNEFDVFAPTIEDIMPRLPKYCILQYWAGQPSCSFQDDEHPMRTVCESFTEAAAKMWLDWRELQG